MNFPLISVILPVYNGALYLGEAIESILNQTFKDFEFIIINDGSKDKSEDIIKSYNDKRIKYYSQENRGFGATLNRGINLSNGKYIARIDADDISYPERFQKQINFFNNNPSYSMVGTWSRIIPDGVKIRYHKHPTEDLVLKFFLLFNNPFVHSSIMIKREVFENVGFFRENKDRYPCEDYELWSHVARYGKIANIPEVLVIYRESSNSMTRDKLSPLIDNVMKISIENITYYCDNRFSYEIITEIVYLYNCSKIKINYSYKYYKQVLNYVRLKLLDENKVNNKNILEKEMNKVLNNIYIPYIKNEKNKLVFIIKYFLNKILKLMI